MSDPDPAAIMAEHIIARRGLYNCAICLSPWPCLPHRLASALADAQHRGPGTTAGCEHEFDTLCVFCHTQILETLDGR